MALHWIICLIAILPLWLLQNVIHELSHGLTLWFGWRWKFSIYPFPSTKLGRLTFAHVTYSPTAASKDPGPDGWATVAIMPKIVNGIFMVAGHFAALLLDSIPAVSLPLAMFATFNFIDFAVGMLGIFKEKNKNDLWNFQSKTNISVNRLRAVCAILVALMGGFIIMSGWSLIRGVI